MSSSKASYTCTICGTTVVGLRNYRAHMNTHRNPGEPSSSKRAIDWDNLSIQDSIASMSITSTAQDPKGKKKSTIPTVLTPFPDNDLQSNTRPRKKHRTTDDSTPKQDSKRTGRRVSPARQKAGTRKKPASYYNSDTYSPKTRLKYTDKLNIFSRNDPLARQLDITNFRRFIQKVDHKISYRPLTSTAKEELRKLLHSVYNSFMDNHTTSSDDTVKAVIRKMDKKIKQTLVPTTMPSSCFDLEKTQTKTIRLKNDTMALLREKVELELEIFYTSVNTAKLKMEYDALDDPEPETDPLAVIPVNLRKYVAPKSQDLAYDYVYYSKKYPSSSFS